MRFQISTLFVFLSITTAIALPLQSSSLQARAFTQHELENCPSVERLVKEAQGTPVKNAIYWSNDAAQCYKNYADKHNLIALRNLWTSKQVNIWTTDSKKHEDREQCFSRLSQAFALSTMGEVIVVTVPEKPDETGLEWANPDPHLLRDELPILTNPKKGHEVTKITRVNMKTVQGKRGPHMCEVISSKVVWKKGDAVYKYIPAEIV